MSGETRLKARIIHLDSFKEKPRVDELRWLAHTLSVFSRRITRRIFCVSLCCNNLASPVPRSFHSLEFISNRKSFARLSQRLCEQEKIRKKLHEDAKGGYIQLEDYSLILFVSLGCDLFREFDDGFKVWIVLLVRLKYRS